MVFKSINDLEYLYMRYFLPIIKFSLTLAIISFLGFAQSVLADNKKTRVAQSDQAKIEIFIAGYDDESKAIKAALNYELSDGWHIYWKNAGDTGFAQSIHWQESENVKNIEILWPAPTRHIENVSDDISFESYIYKDDVTFPIIITPEDANGDVKVKMDVSYAICADICIPEQAYFEFDIAANYSNKEAFERINDVIENKIPKENGANGLNIADVSIINSPAPLDSSEPLEANSNENSKFLQVTLQADQDLKNADIFIDTGEGFSFEFYKKELKNNDFESIFYFEVKESSSKNKLDDEDVYILAALGDKSVERVINAKDIKNITGNIFLKNQALENNAELKSIPANNDAVSKNTSLGASNYSILIMILFGFLGGLILNIMPCVLPVLSIKLMGIIKYGGGKKKDIATSFIVTALGIVASFLILALLVISLQLAGKNVGWGFHFQEPLFIITLIVILTLFASNLLGLFEIKLPVAIGGLAYKKTEKHSLTGHFLTGMLATTLATPCTAPFLGTAVGFAISSSDSLNIIYIFTAMGVGMASPYLLLSAFPNIVTKLPKAGSWMIKVKYLMAIFLIATVIWLIWVLSHQMGQMAAAAVFAISALMIIKLWAVSKNSLLSKFFSSSGVKVSIIAVLAALTFIIPLNISNNYDNSEVLKAPTGGDSVVSERVSWQEFDENKVDELVAGGNIVFVDVTADWCLTCKVNKLLVLDRDKTAKLFRKNNIIAMRADWTNKDEDIAKYLLKNNRSGIPFNIIYSKKYKSGIILPELLTIGKVDEAIHKAKP